MPIRPIKRDRLVTAPASTQPIVARARVRAPEPLPSPEESAPSASSKRAHHVVDRTTDNWDENGDYIVGKGRPPLATRWQKGRSGNPRGPRPKEKLDPVSAFDREVMADFSAKVNGEMIDLNMGTFALGILKVNAAKGGIRATQQLLELYLSTVRKANEQQKSPELAEWEQVIIDELLDGQGLPARPVVRQDRNSDGAGGDHDNV